MADLVSCPLFVWRSSDIWAQSADFSNLDHGVAAAPRPNVPAVGCGELLDLLIGEPAETAGHVVRLDEIPFTRTPRDVIPVAEQHLPVSEPDEVVGVGVAMDQAGLLVRGELSPCATQLFDALKQPAVVSLIETIRIRLQGARHTVEGIGQLDKSYWWKWLIMQ